MSRPLSLISIGVLAAAAFFLAGRHVSLSAATTTTAEPFWRCPVGYTFETSGSSVHCKKPAWTETKGFMPCMQPTPDLKTDVLNATDMCSAENIAVLAEPLCYPTDLAQGYTKRRVAGRDFCGKWHPAEIIAPNQQITF